MGTRFALTLTGVVTLVVSAGAFVAYRTYQSAEAESGKRELVAQMDGAAKEGIALTVEAYSKKHPLHGANAWPLYEAAAKLESEVIFSHKLLYLRASTESPNKPDLSARTKLVKLLAPVYTQMARAGQLRDCQVPWDPETALDDFQVGPKLEALTKDACLAAQDKASKGQPREALEQLSTFAPLCRHASQSPGLINAMVWMAIDALFDKEIQDILSRYGRKKGVASAASRALLALGPIASMTDIIEAEGLSRLAFFIYVEAASREKGEPKLEQGSDPDTQRVNRIVRQAKVPGMIDRWKVLEIEQIRKRMALVRADGSNWVQLRSDFERSEKVDDASNDDLHAYEVMAAGFNYSDFIEVFAKEILRRRILRQACAILALPTNPKQLPVGGEDAIDPVTGKPLRYERAGRVFTLSGNGDGARPDHDKFSFTFHE